MKTEVLEFIKLFEQFGIWDLPDSVEMLEEGDWTQDHKYQFRLSYVKYKGVIIEIQESRIGSPFTDWFYEDTGIRECEVKEETVIVKKYVPVSEQVYVYGED